tara:strand:+ start:104 stop:340 length:237 start_codon:yes stop_codon:yes gene_type:complete
MIKTTYYHVEQWVPNSPEGLGVWGWTCKTYHDKITDRADAEAKMAEEMARFEEVRAHIANLQANVKFRITEEVKEVPC